MSPFRVRLISYYIFFPWIYQLLLNGRLAARNLMKIRSIHKVVDVSIIIIDNDNRKGDKYEY